MAKSNGSGGDVAPIIVIKKIKKGGGGHHGGAWKVAYADFVTAMMAFFLLLWLLNVTTEEQKNAISNFFDPTHPVVSESESGAGGVMGGTTISTEGAMVSTVQDMNIPQNSGARTKDKLRGDGESKKSGDEESLKKLEEELRKREDQRFEEAKKALEKELEKNPQLAALKEHLMIDITPEGLRIQIVDQEGQPMFPSGSAKMFDKTRALIALASTAIKPMPNKISVRGHTDSVQYRPDAAYTNWELSADRANATRRVLKETGIPEPRLSNVMGKSDTEPLLPDKPADAQNRRISMILEREDLETIINREGADAADDIGAPEAVDEAKEALKRAAEEAAEKGYQRSRGNVYFP